MLLRCLYYVEAFLFDIECHILRYQCFFAWYAVARALLGTHIAVYTFGLWPTPGQQHATMPSSSLEMTDLSVPSTGRSRRSGARLPERLLQPPEQASTERRSA